MHGLQGHPRRTWTYEPSSQKRSRNRSPSSSGRSSKKVLGFIPRHDRLQPSPDDASSFDINPSNNRQDVFWPQNLLPVDIPDARIIVWGYNTIVTKGYEAANKNNIFAHARTLLAVMQRERERGMKIIFVAHSLGGILVKEVWLLSDVLGPSY